MRVRIEDVALTAGVSMKTVSRVLNQEPNVAEDTRRKVEAAIERLQYRPNPSARSLAGQRSYVLGLAYDTPSGNYLMEIQDGVLDACRAHRYSMVLGPVSYGHSDLVADIGELIAHSRCDGLVLAPPLTDDDALIAYLGALGLPFASVSPRDPGHGPGVTLDERGAAAQLVAHLIALGHRRIGHIRGRATHVASEWRDAGYRDALAQAGIARDPALVVDGNFTYESGIDGGDVLLALPVPPTAIFAANDDTASGVLRAAGLRGLSVPGDLSVCGFDDSPISRQIYPTLTTVRQPTREMGRLAATELLKTIRDPNAGRMVDIGYDLQLRQSTAPPRH